MLVFDDFTTSGKSLEWSRNVLYAAGAARVILLTIGKYSLTYTEVYSPVDGTEIFPYELTTYSEGSFVKRAHYMVRDTAVYDVLRTSFQLWADGKAFPPP